MHLAFREEGPFLRPLALKRPAAADGAPHELLREARLAAKVRHPNIVEVLDINVDEDGLFLLMDYVDGVVLSALPMLPVQLSLQVACDVARGLCAAHDLHEEGEHRPIVHRDVSPANIMVAFDGSVRLMDFGLARSVQDPRTSRYLRGTPGYVAPETLRFEAPGPAADVFALGVVLYEQLTGTRLYGDTELRRIARRTLDEPAPQLKQRPDGRPLDAELNALVQSMLAKEAAARPSSRQVVERLELTRRRLVRQEGSLDLATHLEATLTERIQEKRDWLRAQYALVSERALSASGKHAVSSGLAENSAATRSTQKLLFGRPTKQWAIAAALLLAVAGGVTMGLQNPARPDNATRPDSATRPDNGTLSEPPSFSSEEATTGATPPSPRATPTTETGMDTDLTHENGATPTPVETIVVPADAEGTMDVAPAQHREGRSRNTMRPRRRNPTRMRDLWNWN